MSEKSKEEIKEFVSRAMEEFSKQKSIAFAKWLSENTIMQKDEKITTYRYDNANYILEDIYTEFSD